MFELEKRDLTVFQCKGKTNSGSHIKVPVLSAGVFTDAWWAHSYSPCFFSIPNMCSPHDWEGELFK